MWLLAQSLPSKNFHLFYFFPTAKCVYEGWGATPHFSVDNTTSFAVLTLWSVHSIYNQIKMWVILLHSFFLPALELIHFAQFLN